MKIIFSRIMLVLLWVSQSAFSQGIAPLRSTITSLVVNAEVTIVLLNENGEYPGRSGDSVFMNQVSVVQKGNSLFVNSLHKKDYRCRGIVYITAGQLEHIAVNNCSRISSSDILQIPHLKLSINGECDVNIRVNGHVELSGNDSYEIDYHSKDLPGGGSAGSHQFVDPFRA